jgi:hypothetical protein
MDGEMGAGESEAAETGSDSFRRPHEGRLNQGFSGRREILDDVIAESRAEPFGQLARLGRGWVVKNKGTKSLSAYTVPTIWRIAAYRLPVRPTVPNMNALALLADQSQRNQGQSHGIPAIWPDQPDGERIWVLV